MRASTTFYFVIYSDTGCSSAVGLRPKVCWTSDENIIEAAAFEIIGSDETMESMAGVEWIEDEDGNMQPARELTYDEVLALSIKKLGDDGRLYTTFGTDESGAADFVKRAKYYGLKDKACAIVEEFNS